MKFTRQVAASVFLGTCCSLSLLETRCLALELAAAQLSKSTSVVRPFDLRQVRLLDGPFQRAMDLNRSNVLAIEPDRLLHNFKVNAGLSSSAKPLASWEGPSSELRGHFTGHYLSACALMFAASGDTVFKERAAAVVAGLAECQAENPSGYLSAFPEQFFDRLEAGGKVWAPYYVLHKLIAGLLDVHRHCGNPQALEVARRLGDWLVKRNATLSEHQMKVVLATEHGGISESLLDLYELTGEATFMDGARRFFHASILDPAARGEDRLNGLHANTQVPKFIGAARFYELTGDEQSRRAAEFFWKSVTRERSYVTGGSSEREHFTAKQQLSQSLSRRNSESCVAYNMLRLTRRLFSIEPLAEYGDYYERTIYNQILASQNPANGGLCYFVPLQTGSQKIYSTFPNCCTGTGIESHARYGESIYFHNDAALYVSLFIPSQLEWDAKGLKIRQETRYPDEPRTRIHFACDTSTALAVKLRHPWWSPTNGVHITVNGVAQKIGSEPSAWIEIKRTWKSGDMLEMTMPFALRTEGFRDNPSRVAFMHGPLVLCAELGTNILGRVIVTKGEGMSAIMKPIQGNPNHFECPPEMFPGATDSVILEPFYKMHGGREYAVYWDIATPVHEGTLGAERIDNH